jgi:hypothetical protein
MLSQYLDQTLVFCFSSTIQTNESLRMNSEEVDKENVGGGVRAIPFSLGKSSNVETFEE